ncbi:MAG TPA: hypothetical protein VGJ20_30435 [Xanthobacteraceae bacterium]
MSVGSRNRSADDGKSRSAKNDRGQQESGGNDSSRRRRADLICYEDSVSDIDQLRNVSPTSVSGAIVYSAPAKLMLLVA